MGQVNNGDAVMTAWLVTPLSTGSSIFTVTEQRLWVFADDVRVKLELNLHAPRQSRHAARVERVTLPPAQRQKILDNLKPRSLA
jgi:hypothetical protein